MPQSYPLIATRVTYAKLITTWSLGFHTQEAQVDSRDPQALLETVHASVIGFIFYDRIVGAANANAQEVALQSDELDHSGCFFIDVKKKLHRSDVTGFFRSDWSKSALEQMDKWGVDYAVEWGKPHYAHLPFDPSKDALLRR